MLEQLHPALWRAHQLAQPRERVCASGFAALDAQLPGGGWPARTLTELLLPHPGVGELRLLAPALAAVQHSGHSVMWFDPPVAPCGWTLAALGLDLRQLLLVQSGDRQQRPRLAPGRAGQRGPGLRRLPAADLLWALERALESGHLGAVLAWLPLTVRPESLRRLQLAAQAHDGPVWLLRDCAPGVRSDRALGGLSSPAFGARHSSAPGQLSGAAPAARPGLALPPSPAPLRLVLAASGPDELCLRIVKRRGPPLAEALHLVLPPVLSAPARARAQRGAAVPAGTGMPLVPKAAPAGAVA